MSKSSNKILLQKKCANRNSWFTRIFAALCPADLYYSLDQPLKCILQQGPVESRLRSFPPLVTLVVGPNAECSEDFHDLLNTMAESKTRHQCRSRGEVESEWKLASNLTYLRRQISVCAVRAIADSLLSRLQQVGPGGRGAASAARRRAEAFGREERGRRERAAHWLLHTRGHRVLQRGQFL